MRRALLAGLLLALAGCSTGPTRAPAENPEQAWRNHAGQLARLDAWRLTGRIAVVSDSEAWHATADWRQDHQAYDIRLIGPMGQGSVQLQGGSRAVTLRDSDGHVLRSDDAEALLYHETGWRVPVAALRYWVLGLPAPGTVASRTLDPQGRLAALEQSGWRIRFLDYGRQDGYELPGRVFAPKDGTRVRLVVGRWRPPGTSGAQEEG